MKKFQYISSSIIPSDSANSVHVVHQCSALAGYNIQVELYAKRSQRHTGTLKDDVATYYGVDMSNVRLHTFHKSSTYGDALIISIIAFVKLIFSPSAEQILTRNLYAAFFLSLMGRPLIFEVHDFEYGFRKYLQRFCLTRRTNHIILISQKLVENIQNYHRITLLNVAVLHDAAPDGIELISMEKKYKTLDDVLGTKQIAWRNFDAVVGYFGQLHQGRGINIIKRMAQARPNYLFVIFGGHKNDVRRLESESPGNMIFFGHVPNYLALQYQKIVDILLMPYQTSVSIGVKGHDTAKWMSPMKLFEYMASGVPLISSDLPVLREVLQNEINSLMVPPDDIVSWINALDSLVKEPNLSAWLAGNAYEHYQANFSWKKRASRILNFTATRSL